MIIMRKRWKPDGMIGIVITFAGSIVSITEYMNIVHGLTDEQLIRYDEVVSDSTRL